MKWPAGSQRTPVDELALRDAVIGDGLLLIPRGEDEWDLRAVHAGHAYCLGTRLSTLAALRVVDELDVRRGRRRAAVL